MLPILLSLIIALCTSYPASAAPLPQLIRSKWPAPQEFKALSPVPESSIHTITLSLHQRNIDDLYRLADDVSNPRHSSYQKYATLTELNQLTAPDPSHMARTLEWLFAAGLLKSELTLLPHTVRAKTSVKNINRLFGTTLYHYQHKSSSKLHIACDGTIALPEDIHQFIALHIGVTTFPPKIAHHIITGASRRLSAVSQFGTVSPRDLAGLYEYEDRSQRSKDNRTSVAAIQFNVDPAEPDSFSPDDVRIQGQLSNVPNIQYNPVLFQGRNNGSDNPQNEASLDIQALTANNPVTTAWSWQNEGGNWIPSWVVEFELLIDSGAVFPQVVTISYSSWELFDDASRQQSDIAFAKFALLGVTMIASSGDSGASGSYNQRCLYGDGRPNFYGEWPSTSPFVTSVGATNLKNPDGTVNGQNVPVCGLSSDRLPAGVTSGQDLQFASPWQMVCLQEGDEVAAERPLNAQDNFGTTFASGGGFSRVYPRPDWQNRAVQRYLNASVRMPPSSFYNTSYRGVPDISMYGAGMAVLVNRELTVQGGTSLSSPLFAAVVAMMNEISLQYTNRTLGNVNRLLYQMYDEYPKAFRDIVEGSNRGTIALYRESCEGYQATAGWDPVTGLGVVRVAYFEAYLVHVFTGNPIVDPPEGSSSLALSTGAIIGIAVGGGVAVIALIVLIIVCVMMCCRKPNNHPPPQRADNVRNGQRPVALIGAIAPAKHQPIPLQPIPQPAVVVTSATEPHNQHQPHLSTLPVDHGHVHVDVQPH